MSGPRARRVSVVAGLASQRILETAQTLLAGPGRGAEAKFVPEGAARVERDPHIVHFLVQSTRSMGAVLRRIWSVISPTCASPDAGVQRAAPLRHSIHTPRSTCVYVKCGHVCVCDSNGGAASVSVLDCSV